MNTYRVRELFGQSVEELHQLPIVHQLEFDDGAVIESTQFETVYSSLFWRLFVPYPTVKVRASHHVLSALNGESLTTDTHPKLCSAILESIVVEAGLRYPEQKEPLLAAIYLAISDAMSELSLLSEAYVTSIDILDFIQIAHDPRVKALKEEAYEDPRKIKYVYENVVKLIETDPLFHDNGLARAMRAKMVKTNQVVQCVVFRGYPTEVDNAIFKQPIWTNYTFGNTRFYDLVADSRLGAKAHYYADTALKDSEYMARQFQLFSTVVDKIKRVDCGSTKLVTWKIRGEEYDTAGTVIYPGDLPMLIGKYYYDDKGTMLWITGKEKHLIGQTIKFRSLLGCQLEDPHHVCEVCVGKLSENISRFTNLGHLGAITTTKETTQNILSIKHVNTSSTALRVHLGDHERRFLNEGVEGTAIFLNPPLQPTKPTLTILREEATGLVDLSMINEIERVSLPQISQIKKVLITIQDKGRPFSTELDVQQKGKPSMLSREVLLYLKHKKWTMDTQNNFVFNMDEWDYQFPVFVMENKEESFVDLAASIDKLVRSSQQMVKKRQIENAPQILLQELFYLVNSKLKVNVLSMETIVLGLTVRSVTDYSLSRGAAEPVLGIAELLTKYRSLGAALAYENQYETLTNPISFFKGTRPDSPMDVFLCPQEVMDSPTLD